MLCMAVEKSPEAEAEVCAVWLYAPDLRFRVRSVIASLFCEYSENV